MESLEPINMFRKTVAKCCVSPCDSIFSVANGAQDFFLVAIFRLWLSASWVNILRMPNTLRMRSPPQLPAETAPPIPLKLLRRPIKVMRFDVDKGLELLEDLARNKACNHAWNWDGTAYPETQPAEGPNLEALTAHAEVLYHLLTLAPSGYPCMDSLCDLFCQLHRIWHIFDDDGQCVEARAMLASKRWRIMCRHCVMLNIQNTQIDNSLINVVSLVRPVFMIPPAKSWCHTDIDNEVDAAMSLELSARINRPIVPYLPNGLSDWAEVDELLRFWNQGLRMQQVKMAQAKSKRRKRKPGFTTTAQVREPAHKKNRRSPAETAIPAAIDEPTPEPTAIEPNNAANKSPEKPFAVPVHLKAKLDRVKDFAAPPNRVRAVLKKRRKRRRQRERRRLALAATAASKKIESEPVKVKNGELTSQKPTETQKNETDTEEQAIGPPYRLRQRFNPIEKSQSYLLGTVAGRKYQLITNITPAMHVEFSVLMEQIYREAMNGALQTKEQANRRRDALIEKAAVPPVAPAGVSPPGCSLEDWRLTLSACRQRWRWFWEDHLDPPSSTN